MSDLSPQAPEPAVMVEVTSSRSPLQAFSYNETNYVVNYANQQHQAQPSDIVEAPNENWKGKSNNKSTVNANVSRPQYIKRNAHSVITQTVVPISSVGSSNKGKLIIGGYAHQAHQVVNATSCMTKVSTAVLKNVIAGARTTACNVNQNVTLTTKQKAPLAMTVIASKPPVATKLNPNTATYLLLAPVQSKNGANKDGQTGQSPKHILINLSKPQTFKIPSPVTGGPSNKPQTILLTSNRTTGKFGTLVQTRPFQSVSTATATSTTTMSLSSVSNVPRMVVPMRQIALNSNLTNIATMRPPMYLNKAGNLVFGQTKMTTTPTVQFLNQTQLIPAQTRPSIQPMSQILYSRPAAQYLSPQPQHYVSVPPTSNPAYQQQQPAMTASQYVQQVSPASPLQMAYQAQSTVNQKKRPLENSKSSPVKKKQPIASTITSSPVSTALSPHELAHDASMEESSFLPEIPLVPTPHSSTFFYEGSLEQMITQAYMNTLGRPLAEECMAQYHTPPGNWVYQRMFLSYQNVVMFKQATVDLIKSKRKSELEDCAHEMYLNWLAVLVLRACYFSIPRNRKAATEVHGPVVYRRRRIWFEPFGNETIHVRPVGEKISINTLLQSLDNFYEVVDSLNLTQVELALVSAFLLFSDPDVQDEPLTSKQLRNHYRDEIKHVMFEMQTTSPKGLIRHMDLMFSLAEVVAVSSCISFADCC